MVAGYSSFSAGFGERKVGRMGLHREEDLDLDFSSALEAGEAFLPGPARG